MKYKIQFSPEVATIRLYGAIDERIGEILAEIRPQLRTKRVAFDLEQVDHVNSIGISTWIAHMQAFDTHDVEFVRVPYTFISLCRIIPILTQKRTIQSFQVRYYCDKCNDDEVQYSFVDRAETLLAGALKKQPCRRCRNLMEADEHDLDYIDMFQAA